MVQKISALDDSAKLLESKDIIRHHSETQMEKVVTGRESIRRSYMECKSLSNQGYVEGVLKKSERDYLWSLIGEIDITDEKKKQKQLTDIDNEFANTVLMHMFKRMSMNLVFRLS